MSELTEQAPAITYVDALENASATLQAGIEQAQQGLTSALQAKLEVDKLIHESRSALSSSPEAIESHLRAAVETYLQRLKEPAASPLQAARATQAANAEIAEADANQPESAEPDLEGLKAGIDEEVLGTRYQPIEDDEFEGADSVNPEALAQTEEDAVASAEAGAGEAPPSEPSEAEGVSEAQQWTETPAEEATAEPLEAPEALEESEPQPVAAGADDAVTDSEQDSDWAGEEAAGPSASERSETELSAVPEEAPEEAPDEVRQSEPASTTDNGGEDTPAAEQQHNEHEALGSSEDSKDGEESPAPTMDSEHMEPRKEGLAESLKRDGESSDNGPPQKRRSVLGLLKGR